MHIVKYFCFRKTLACISCLALFLDAVACTSSDASEVDTGEFETDDTDSESLDTDTQTESDNDTDSGEPEDIADRLRQIEGLTVEELPTSNAGYRYFSLHYLQPADHDNPTQANFSQYMTLVHISTDAPMVFLPLGYANWQADRLTELALLIGANQLAVEHRFFSSSLPNPTDWTLLTIKEAAADHHRIVDAFKPIYSASWISTGASKGGMTTTYHRRFYPDDVSGSVPYVAPLSYGAPDARYIDFLDNVEDQVCLANLRALQVEVLTRREEMLALLDDFAASNSLSFNRIGGLERALESVILDFPYTFWQYFGVSSCTDVPDSTATDQLIFDFVDEIIGFNAVSDLQLDFFGPYYYQAQFELGYPDLATSHLAGLLSTDPPTPEEGLPPEGAVQPAFDPNAMLDIADWIANEGDRLMFIYGEWDPWTAGAYDLGVAQDSFRFIVAQGTHHASISELDADDYALALDALERWTGVKPKPIPAGVRYYNPDDSRRWLKQGNEVR